MNTQCHTHLFEVVLSAYNLSHQSTFSRVISVQFLKLHFTAPWNRD